MRRRNNSATSLKTLEQCELKYYLSYEDKIDGIEDDTKSLSFGKIVHLSLQEIYTIFTNSLKPGSRFSGEDYDRVYNTYFKAAAEEKLSDVVLLQEGWSIVKSRMDSFNYDEKVLSIENVFTLETPKGTKFTGAMDKVLEIDDSTILIVDYKTSQMALTQSEADSDIQVSMYDLAASILWPKKTIVVMLDYLRLTPVMTFRTAAQRKMFRDFLDHTDDYIVSLDETTVKPKLNQFCGWCKFKKTCPAFTRITSRFTEKELFLSGMSTDELIVEWKTISDVKKAAEAHSRSIKMFVENVVRESDSCSLDGTSEKLSRVQNASTRYNIEDIKDVIPTQDMFRVCTVNKSSLDKYLVDHPDIAEKVKDKAQVSYMSPFFKVQKK